ncbi:hypothetical protein GCM10009853_046280 [Glycomyces scopariae]
MELTPPLGRIIKNATREQVRNAAVELNLGAGEFLILAAGDEYYIQAYLEDSHDLHMEYREGSARYHFQSVQPCSPAQMIDLVLSYFDRNFRWRTMIEWKPEPELNPRAAESVPSRGKHARRGRHAK